MIDMGVEPFMLGTSLVMTQAQRLYRKLCPACKKETEARKEKAVEKEKEKAVEKEKEREVEEVEEEEEEGSISQSDSEPDDSSVPRVMKVNGEPLENVDIFKIGEIGVEARRAAIRQRRMPLSGHYGMSPRRLPIRSLPCPMRSFRNEVTIAIAMVRVCT